MIPFCSWRVESLVVGYGSFVSFRPTCTGAGTLEDVQEYNQQMVLSLWEMNEAAVF